MLIIFNYPNSCFAPRWRCGALVCLLLALTSCGSIVGKTVLSETSTGACAEGQQNISVSAGAARYHGCQTTAQTTDINAVRSFKGIRYAQAGRWQAPVLLRSQGDVDATSFGKLCPQFDNKTSSSFNSATMSEDCLFLNIWSPPIGEGESLPVMVMIHGGGFVSGSGSQQLLSGEVLAAKHNAIIVTLNYRLGVLGFFYREDASGNFGIQDQQLALQWLQDNIHYFGGDEQRVTLVGESAGAMSVGIHLYLSNFDGADTFSQAIMESSYYGVSYKSTAEAKYFSDFFASELSSDCELTECTTEELMSAQSDALGLFSVLQSMFVFGPYLEPYLLTEAPVLQTINKPVIIGNNSDEAMFFSNFMRPLDDWAYKKFLAEVYGLEISRQILQNPRYNLQSQAAIQALENVVNDAWFVCASDYLLAESGAQETAFGFDYGYVSSFNFYGILALNCRSTTCHGAELPFVFDRQYNGFDAPVNFDEDDMAMAAKTTAYWMQFIQNGTVPELWRPFYSEWQTNGRFIMDLNTGASYTLDEERACDFWADKVYSKGGVQGAVRRMFITTVNSPYR